MLQILGKADRTDDNQIKNALFLTIDLRSLMKIASIPITKMDFEYFARRL